MATDVARFNRQSPGEEIANSISHGLGALLAIAGMPILIVWATMHGDALSIVSASLTILRFLFLFWVLIFR
ncbi:MAG: hypothetical protein OSJ64_06715 [Firmicutes bacterium]|nr:hypothetical protein [Bacillota bacterium]